MNTQLVCLTVLAAAHVVLSAPSSYSDFNSFFKSSPLKPNFRPWNSHPVVNERSAPVEKPHSGLNHDWSRTQTKNQQQQHQLGSRTSHSYDSISSESKLAGRTMFNDDDTPQAMASMIGARQSNISSIPVISVPPLLPPIPGITEQMLYGSVNIDALTAPYSSGDNTTENQTPIQLPSTSEVLNGTVNVYDHGFLISTKVQEVVSNHQINTFTNQTNNVTVNNLDLHRFYKLVNATTNYITNVLRVNQSAIFNEITNSNGTEYQPYLYIVQSQTNTVNDNQTAVQLPVIESSSISSVTLPPVFDTPVVVKYDYNGNPVPINGTA